MWRGSQRLARITATSTTHYHLDHLGTPRLHTNGAGAMTKRLHVFPFGRDAPGTASASVNFTGHERDNLGSGSGVDDMDYMHARFYSPQMARFFSVDPVGGDPKYPQSWNRYTYTQNNPLRYVDPTGEFQAPSEIADDLDDQLDELELFLSNQLPANATGIVLDTLLGTVADLSRGMADVLRLGEATGTAIGEGAGAGETALAVGVDLLRATAIAAPVAGAGRAAAGRATLTVVHYTDDAGRAAIRRAGNLRAGTFVTRPRDVRGMTARQIEQRLEIQAGRGSHSFTVRTQRRNLAIPANGRRTSGGAFQRQLRQPCDITRGSC